MDTFELIASVVGSLAWPAAVFGTALVFKKNIEKLLPLIQIKYKDINLNFLLTKAENDAAQLPDAVDNGAAEPTAQEDNQFERLAKLSPSAAILDVRREIEAAVQSLAKYASYSTVTPNSILSLTRALGKQKIIDDQTIKLLDDLRIIGNSAAHNHGANISFEEAVRFRELANKAIIRIEMAEAKLRPDGNMNAPDPY